MLRQGFAGCVRNSPRNRVLGRLADALNCNSSGEASTVGRDRVTDFSIFVVECLLVLLPVKDWALSERCKSCSNVRFKTEVVMVIDLDVINLLKVIKPQ